MNADDKSKLKAYEELIGSLEHTNGLQHRKNLQPFNREKNISEWKNSTLHRCVPWNVELQNRKQLQQKNTAMPLRFGINGLRFLNSCKKKMHEHADFSWGLTYFLKLHIIIVQGRQRRVSAKALKHNSVPECLVMQSFQQGLCSNLKPEQVASRKKMLKAALHCRAAFFMRTERFIFLLPNTKIPENISVVLFFRKRRRITQRDSHATPCFIKKRETWLLEKLLSNMTGSLPKINRNF